MSTDVIQEITVMADHQNGTFVIHQEVFQPHYTGKIQVVGRLVQEDDVRIAKQCLCQKDLYLKAGIHIGHQSVIIFCGDTETLQQSSGVGFRFISAQLCEFLFQFCRTHAVFIGKVFLLVNGIFFLATVVKTLIPHNDCIHNGIVVVEGLILFQYRHSGFAVDENMTGCRLELSGEDFYKS